MEIMNCRSALLGLFLIILPLVTRAQQLKLGASPAVLEKSALLDLNSDKQGLLLPRVSDYTTAPLNAAPDGMLIYYVPEKLLYIRKNGIWRKLIDETNAITSVNGQTGPLVNLTTNNITESVNLYYTDARARAAFSAGTGINITGAGVISALNSSAIWNASQLQGRNIATTAPANNDVLSWDNTTGSWVPKSATSGSVTSVGLALPSSVFNVSGSPVTSTGTLTGTFASQNMLQVFASPVAGNGVPSFRALDALDIPAGSNHYIQSINSGTQTANYAISGNGRVGGTFTLPSLTAGSVLFTGTGGVVSESNTDFFWDNTNKRLGIGTATPANKLEIAGTVAASGLSGLRLKDLGTATVQSYTSKVLSINSTGDVIVTDNPAGNNWLITGNAGVAAGSFLGTRDDKAMVIKSNDMSYLEFGRRQTLGLTQSYTDYTDDNEKVTYVRSALQFEVPATVSFYKPKMWTTADGNFRVKGASAGTDYFEFGATGTNNNGGFDFIIGDDGDEPISFKSYYYATTAFTEIMRLQSGKVGIGVAGATPSRSLHVAGDMRLTGSAGTATGILGRDAAGDISNVSTDATTLTLSSGTLSAKNTSAVWNASQLQGRNVATTAPASGQVLSWNGTAWAPATSGSSSGWALTGNAGTSATTNFVGTTDGAPLVLKSTGNVGINNTAPNSTLSVGGAISAPVYVSTLRSENVINADNTMYLIYLKRTGNQDHSVTINLPAAATCTGRIYVIVRMYTSNAYGGVTVNPYGTEQIMGKNGIVLYDIPPLTIQSTGVDWIATYGSQSYSSF